MTTHDQGSVRPADFQPRSFRSGPLETGPGAKVKSALGCKEEQTDEQEDKTTA
jgi:hypothetical protein